MAERRLLAVSAVPLQPASNGYAVRVGGMLSALARDWSVVLVAPRDEEGAGDPLRPPDALERIDLPRDLVPQVPLGPSATSRAALQRWVAGRVDAIRPSAALLWSGMEFLGFSGGDFPPAVADRIDCYSLTLWRALGLRTGRSLPGSMRDLVAAARYERRLARALFATVVVGEDDARALRRLSGRDTIHVIPNGVRVEGIPVGAREDVAPTVIFTGVLSYGPNVEAACHLADEIWPAVRAAVPKAQLVIAGRAPSPAVLGLATRPGISVLADVPDLRAVLARAWVGVAPMRTGSGIKNKVLEAWALAKPVVLSPLAANGLEFDAATRACIAPNVSEFAAAVIRLLGSAEERHRIGAASHRIAATAHGWARAGERLTGLLEAAIQSRSQRESAGGPVR